MSYYSGNQVFEDTARRLSGKYLVDYRKPSGDYYLTNHGDILKDRGYVNNEHNNGIRFIVSDHPPQTPPEGAFGKVYPRGIKCAGTWIPVDFRQDKISDWLIGDRDHRVIQNSWGDAPGDRIIVQKIESGAAPKENLNMKKSNKLEKSDLQNYVFEVTADEIYPNGVTVPEGWEVFDFGPPSVGESFIDGLGIRDIAYTNWNTYPRLLIRKPQIDWDKELNTAAMTGWDIPKGWRAVAFRPAKSGEFYAWNESGSPTLGPYLGRAACDHVDARIILERCPTTFVVDGVTFDNPVGYEFVRTGFITEKESEAGLRAAYLRGSGRVGELWEYDMLTHFHAIFRPV